MLTVQENAFVKPYPQEALGGDLGLTSNEIAEAIGVSHRHLLQDFRSRKYVDFLRNAGFQLAEISANRQGRGRKGKMFVLDVDAAKAAVATSRTEHGAGYLRYLISCERKVEVAESLIPQLMAKIVELEQKLAALSKPKRIPGPGRRHRVVAGFRTVTDLWGNDAKVPVYRELAFSEMTDDERRAYEAQHLSKISSGASKKAAKLINHEVEPGGRHVVALVPKKL